MNGVIDKMTEPGEADIDLDPEQGLRIKLNADTGRIGWSELQGHFARGSLVVVAHGVDLVEAAYLFAKDDKAAVGRMIAEKKVSRATDAEAKEWHERNAQFWAVVVAPWVLVQEIGH